MEENETEFDAQHLIVPNALPNYVKGLHGELRSGSPPQVTESDTLGFMVNSLQYYASMIVIDG